MKKKFFIRNLILFLLPLLIPMFLFGSLASIITQRSLKDNIQKNNLSLLEQCKENIELTLQDEDAISLNFNTDPKISKRFKDILGADSVILENFDTLYFLKNSIDVPAYSKPHIYSIYVYFENEKNNFLSSTDGLSNLKSFYDTEWYDSYVKNKTTNEFWYEERDIKQFSFENKVEHVVTIYRKLRSPGAVNGDGVIVMNLRRSYIEGLLQKLTTYDKQTILVADPNGNVIFKNGTNGNLNNFNLHNAINDKRNFYTTFIGTTAYTVSVVRSDRYQWSYYSIVPQNSLYKLLNSINLLFFMVFLLSIFLGFALCYYITWKNYHRVLNIISIIECAENNQPLPPMPEIIKDEYSFIVQNILKTFIEQKYLNVQLSERKYKMTALELMALQSQINPHFLYNTLHTIYWEVFNLTKGPNMANSMLEYLTDILEYSLSNPNEQVTIEEELKNTRSYIAIQKIRYKDKFDVEWEYSEKLLDIKIIKLILQPLIENSIYHGIKQKSGRSLIKIKLRIIGDFLRISIIDSGLGIEKNRLFELRKTLHEEKDATKHIGLYNTSKRLQLFYGPDCEIKILSKYGLGTAVYINIPLNKDETSG